VFETSTPVECLRAFALPGGETALDGVHGRADDRSNPQRLPLGRARLRAGPFHALALAVTDGPFTYVREETTSLAVLR
jgi:hypothetical protein